MPLYFMSTLAYFWFPSILLGLILLPKQDRSTRRAIWLTLAIFIPLTAAMEYVCLYLDIWTFSEKKDPLLGVRIFGAPVEEFSFWFGAQPFVLFSYIGFDWLLRRAGSKPAGSASPAARAGSPGHDCGPLIDGAILTGVRASAMDRQDPRKMAALRRIWSGARLTQRLRSLPLAERLGRRRTE